ncbi:uroporphyrinogen-III synthase [uncultured Shewanella sp.]|uniref:uroporphyrinogen-III synthase n=1 Tax=Shewanella atlantica TaxID=271099 RepID=UPI00263297E8|nr:uroporphyrinogen-III synthase [uncultured Shewanella sp.]
MKVLLTRPQGRNQSMIEALNERGVSHLVTPLLNVQATDIEQHQSSIEQFSHADIVIFISTNAVKFASEALNNKFPQSAQFYAVGEATYQALLALGINSLKAPQECQQTEGLLTLKPLHNISDKKIVIVRGVGGREALAEALSDRGAVVNYWEAYQRGCPKLDIDSTLHEWQKAEIDTIVVTSGEILHNLIKLVPKELFAWLRACHIIVPSSRVEDQALASGLLHVTNAKAANCKAVLSALKLTV